MIKFDNKFCFCEVKRINVENAHDGLRKICEEFGIPILKKTFGKFIVRVPCKTAK